MIFLNEMERYVINTSVLNNKEPYGSFVPVAHARVGIALRQ